MTLTSTSLPTPKLSVRSICKQTISSIFSLCRLTWRKLHLRLNKNWLGQSKPSKTIDKNKLHKKYVDSKITTTWETRRKSLQAKSNNNSSPTEPRTTVPQRGRSKKSKSVDWRPNCKPMRTMLSLRKNSLDQEPIELPLRFTNSKVYLCHSTSIKATVSLSLKFQLSRSS